MRIMDKIRHAFAANSAAARADEPDMPEDTYLGTQLSTTGVIPDVPTSATDPALHDAAAGGVQPMQKPVEVEREQNPEARRDNEVVRKNRS